jgi:hypothetical protein
MRRAILLTLLAASTGCSTGAAPVGPPAGPPVSSVHPAFGKLRLRDRTITLRTSGGALLVTLQDSAGKVLAEDLSMEQLRDRDPFAFEACESSLARGLADIDAELHKPSQFGGRSLH